MSLKKKQQLGLYEEPNLSAAYTPPTHLLPIRVSAAYDTYWRFAVERQNVFFRRLSNDQMPWSTDPIISLHKFTNAYRASDRVSQYLIRHVIYRDDLPKTVVEVFFRTLLFKFFNKIETWELLQNSLGEITFENYLFENYDKVLSQAMLERKRIYSAAYIMPPGGSAFGHKLKHQNHLRLLELMMHDGVPQTLTGLTRMQSAFELLRSYPTIGDFLAYQFVTDINYSEITNFSEMDFVIPGPGARDGIRKCFSDMGGLNEAEIIRLMVDNQDQEFERLGLDFKSLWGRKLQLIDCQNLFCEVDKYSRVAHPEIAGISGRIRIKQKFSPSGKISAPWYPPKWGINEKISDEFQTIKVGEKIKAKKRN
ncbi:nucleotide kinase domain-containing protein [Herminiimonas aquatilis]|uniref:Nucleotide kinase domain-containing protein n=1 Tax=Herminiimonas aquatilis TaxID=345342 RepID=A0ABW2J7E1_9BURK